jgi:hypothetical protein
MSVEQLFGCYPERYNGDGDSNREVTTHNSVCHS